MNNNTFVDHVVSLPEITSNRLGSDLRQATISTEATGLIMGMLSDAYSRPEEAVLRELIANGIDAQALSGNKAPIEVSLPDEGRDNLIITDHGVGMNQAQLLNNFADYGNSTKAGDPLSIGRFGIGAKSPYAVTNQFTVTTTRSGITTTALFTLNERGIPSHQIISVQHVGASSGTSITIPTDRRNYQTWHRAANQVARYLNPDTIVFADRSNGSPMQQASSHISNLFVPQLTTPQAAILNQPIVDGIRVIMGQIGYSIPASLLNRFSYPQRMLFLAEPSSLELTHTREYIKDSPHNHAVLNDLHRQWRETLFGELDAQWKSATSIFQQIKLVPLEKSRREAFLENKRNYEDVFPVLNTQPTTLLYTPKKKREYTHLTFNFLWQFSTDNPNRIFLDAGSIDLLNDQTSLRKITEAVTSARGERPELEALLISSEELAGLLEAAQPGNPDYPRALPPLTVEELPLIQVEDFIAKYRKSTAKKDKTGDLIFHSFFQTYENGRPAGPTGIYPQMGVVHKRHSISYTEEEIRTALASTKSKTLVLCNSATLEAKHTLIYKATPKLREHISDAVFVVSTNRSRTKLAKLLGASRVVDIVEHVNDCVTEFVKQADEQEFNNILASARNAKANITPTTILMQQNFDFEEYEEIKSEAAVYNRWAKSLPDQRWANQVLRTVGIKAEDLPELAPGFDKRYPLLIELAHMMYGHSSIKPSEKMIRTLIKTDKAGHKRLYRANQRKKNA